MNRINTSIACRRQIVDDQQRQQGYTTGVHNMSNTYKSQAARDAQAAGYGTKAYWDELDRHAQELHDYFAKNGDEATAERMLTRSLSESLRGNEGT